MTKIKIRILLLIACLAVSIGWISDTGRTHTSVIYQTLFSDQSLTSDERLISNQSVFMIDTLNYPDYYATSAITARNGDILLFVKAGASHAERPPNSIVMYRSSNDGDTWSSQVVAAGDAEKSYVNPIAGVTETGRILLLYGGYPQRRMTGYMRYSDNHGANWSEELHIVDIGISKQDYVNSVGNIIINPSNHDILYAGHNQTDSYHSLVLYKSTEAENGLNWSLVGTTIVSHAAWEFYEPCLAYVDERLFCGIRCDPPGDGQVFGYVYSDDHGLTWSDLHIVEEIVGTQWTYIPVPWGLAVAARGSTKYIAGQNHCTKFFTSPDGMSFSPEFQYLSSPWKPEAAGYCSSVTLPDGDIMLFQANGAQLLGYTLSF